MNFKIISSASFEPGAPNRNNSGPVWASGLHDDLALPNGSTVGQTSNEVLREQFAKIGLEGAHRDGREVLCRRYAELLSEIGMGGYSAAVSAFLQKHRG